MFLLLLYLINDKTEIMTLPMRVVSILSANHKSENSLGCMILENNLDMAFNNVKPKYIGI